MFYSRAVSSHSVIDNRVQNMEQVLIFLQDQGQRNDKILLSSFY